VSRRILKWRATLLVLVQDANLLVIWPDQRDLRSEDDFRVGRAGLTLAGAAVDNLLNQARRRLG